MACGVKQTISVRTWSISWIGRFPSFSWKTVEKTRYQYEFQPWRERWSWPFHRSYEGCCGGDLFAWSYWAWSWGTTNSEWVDQTLTYFSDATIGSVEKCPFQPGIGVE